MAHGGVLDGPGGHSQAHIAKVLGHSSTATTDRYLHLAPEHLKAAVEAVEAASMASQMATQTPPPVPPVSAPGGSATLPAS